MKADMIVPDDAVKYILFQRTAYLRFPVTPVYRFLNRLSMRTPLYNLVVALESRLGKARTKALYAADMFQEYQSLAQVLPAKCTAVLDIGCGVAGIDVFLYRHYQTQPVHFYLLDKSHVEKQVWYLFNNDGAFYTSLPVAKRVLVHNGVPEHRVHALEADTQHMITIGTKVDVIISLLSWGFHYPVTTYLHLVHTLLHERSLVILDIRKGTDGMDVLKQTFPSVSVLLETDKYYRIVARNQQA